ncbi:MAG: ribonuclease HII, partial [Candidatus Bipolaricaulaceae bacterium]
MDEAGRGAVLGPLIVAGVVLPAADLPGLAALNVKESKSVARTRRAALLRQL